MHAFPRWLTAVLAMTMGVILIGSVWFYLTQEQRLRRDAEAQLLVIAQMKAEQIAAWRADCLNNVATLVESPSFNEEAMRWIVSPQAEDAERIRVQFRLLQKFYQYRDVLLVDSSGQVKFSLFDNPGELQEETKQALAVVLREKRPRLTELHDGPEDNAPHLHVLAPFFAPGGETAEPAGAVIAHVDARDFLFPLIQSWPILSRSAETLLVRQDGSDALFMNDLRHRKDTAHKLRISLSQTEVPAVMAIKGKEGIVYGIDYRGVGVLAALKPIPDSPWFMVSKVDTEEVFSNWRMLSFLLFASILLSVATAVFAVGLIWQRNEKSHYRSLANIQEALGVSEVKYRRLFEAAKDGILILDAETGVIEDVNPFLIGLLGIAQEELLGKRLWELGFFKDIAANQINFEELMQKEYIRYEDLPLETIDGRRIDVEFVSNVYLVNHHKVIQCNIRDITERKRIEKEQQESELRYRILADSGQGLIWTSGIDKKCDYFNLPWLEFTGRTLEQELGDGWVEGVHPDDLDYCVKIYTTAFDRRDRFSMIYRLRRYDGDYRWIQDDGTPRYDTQGNFLGYIGHCLDITKLKRTEEALEQTEKTLRAIFDSAMDGILVANVENGKFVIANNAICRMLGYHHNELLNLGVKDIHPVEELAHIQEQFERIAKGDISLVNNIIVKRKDLSTFYADINASLIELNGRLCLIGLFRDITKRKRVEESINLQTMRIQTLLDLHEISTSSEEEILNFCLNASLRITHSRLSFIGFLDEKESVMTIYAWSQSAMSQCAIDGSPRLFPITDAGLWVECIRQRKPVVINEYEAPHPAKKGYPSGHIPLTRLLCVPVFEKQRIAVVFALANKETDYDEGDVSAVSVLMNKMWEIWRHRQDEETLRISEERYRQFFEQNLAGTLVSSADGCLIDCNPAYLKIFGFSTKEEALHIDVSARYPNPKDREDFLRLLQEKKQLINIEKTLRRIDGKPVYTIENNYGVFNERGDLTGVRAYIFDNTERKLLEEQFRQAQKMEAVGRLAGGVAHDFNNIIMAIRGYSDLILRSLPHDHIAHRDIQEIKKAADRAASLTRQLLAFARKETINPQVLDLNDAVSGILKMIQRLVGEDIALNWTPGKNLFRVKIDPSQLDQILVNLAVNARDAISGVGNITIETANTEFDEAYCACHAGTLPGEYVLLAMSDDGCGMDKETLSKIFEPFFTTKEMGKGTGLGLAAVFGAIKQNDGFINVYSEPGQGTTFRIYLPRFTSGTICTPVKHAEETPRGGKETLLLVEDDAGVLVIGKRMLEELGYTVLIANTPKEAMRLVEETTRTIHLLITDVVMPEMNGRELTARLASIKPDMKCLFMSGYTANVIAHRGVLEEGVHFIQKPFSAETLAAKVREALERPMKHA